MFDIGWTEILVIVIVTILVVGPKELPGLLRTIGKTVGSMRKMAGDFQGQFNEALREAELEDVKNTISDARKLNPTNAIKDAVTKEIGSLDDVTDELKKDLNEASWDFDEAMADVAARKEAANTAAADLVDEGDAKPAADPAPVAAPAEDSKDKTDASADKSSAKAD
ncbi:MULTISPECIES: Sec-independent protein translocase protein TatB [Cohaesibacter]|uniref:Sec-independent protein translocase protein TatB n=1 Tax=Cohaesibacter TaxID=655352 RepID=UPI000DEA3762|nr:MULTISPECIES: Sec-independent protein translocase protein TatB [Cohaesibacter]TLP49079.1 twin-arginine translocase subunit TatB [Cohaesibacter sp. CAU 1516]